MGTCEEQILNSLILGKLNWKIMEFGKNPKKYFFSVRNVLFSFLTSANALHFRRKEKKKKRKASQKSTVEDSYYTWFLFINFSGKCPNHQAVEYFALISSVDFPFSISAFWTKDRNSGLASLLEIH